MFSGVSGAIDEALVALEHGGYIALALPADYSRPNAEWNTLNDIEKRGVPEHMALLLAQNGPKPTRRKSMCKFWPACRKLGGRKQELLDCEKARDGVWYIGVQNFWYNGVW